MLHRKRHARVAHTQPDECLLERAGHTGAVARREIPRRRRDDLVAGDAPLADRQPVPEAATRGFELATLYPQASALGLLAGAAWDAKPLLRTSAQSWTELGHIPKAGEAAAAIRFDADAGEIRGPLDLGFALSRLSPSPAKREQRAAALGDADFLSNAYLGNGGNREFGQRLFNWLLADDALIEVPDRGAPDRSLDLSQRGLGTISVGFLVALPLLLLAAGGFIAWRRRRR